MPAVRGGQHTMAFIFQDGCEQLRDAEFVVHYEDRCHG
jgi:hypothetical protein